MMVSLDLQNEACIVVRDICIHSSDYRTFTFVENTLHVRQSANGSSITPGHLIRHGTSASPPGRQSVLTKQDIELHVLAATPLGGVLHKYTDKHLATVPLAPLAGMASPCVTVLLTALPTGGPLSYTCGGFGFGSQDYRSYAERFVRRVWQLVTCREFHFGSDRLRLIILRAASRDTFPLVWADGSASYPISEQNCRERRYLGVGDSP